MPLDTVGLLHSTTTVVLLMTVMFKLFIAPGTTQNRLAIKLCTTN